mmetsp:Transcript_7665/g.15985  ORF Transcript_7665/g.15985 Transcript_7665/m.15985 type:complete len:240 (+) Transcript_7665:133-852(+)
MRAERLFTYTGIEPEMQRCIHCMQLTGYKDSEFSMRIHVHITHGLSSFVHHLQHNPIVDSITKPAAKKEQECKANDITTLGISTLRGFNDGVGNHRRSGSVFFPGVNKILHVDLAIRAVLTALLFLSSYGHYCIFVPRSNCPRFNDRNLDVEGAQLDTKAIAPCFQSVFGCHVPSMKGEEHIASHANIDNGSLLAFPHMRKNLLGETNQSKKIYFELHAPIRNRHFFGRTGNHIARVVD